MVKVKPNINCCEGGAPARSLRSRKRNSNHETFQTDDATKSPQDCEEKDGAVFQQFPLPECFVVIDQQAQAVGQSSLTKQDLSVEEKPAESINDASDFHLTTEAVPQQKETTVTNPNVSEDHTDGDELKNGKDREEIAVEEYPACTDHLQIVQPIAGEVNGSCEAATVNHQSHSEEKQEPSCNQASDSCLSEIKETIQESSVGIAPKKKRRMGMCGLTEKKRSHFFLAQRRDNGTVSAEMQMSEKPVEESFPSPCLPSLPPSILEETQSNRCGDLDSSKPDVHITATTSGKTDTVCDPEERICEAEPAAVVSSEEIHHPKPDQLVKEDENKEEEQLESQLLQESKQSLTESQIPEKQVEATEDVSNGICDSDVTNHTSSKEERSSQDTVETAVPPVNDVTETQEEKEEAPADAVCSSAADTQAGEMINCGSVEISEVAVTPNVSDKKDQSDPDTKPAAANGERTHATDTSDPFGSTCSDYVSDSQLNTIDLIVEKEKESSVRFDDSTNLICGLIRELSSLNRKVMAAHRELEVLHRRGKSSRNFLR